MPGCMPLVLGSGLKLAARLGDDGVGMDAALFEHRADDAFLLFGQERSAGAAGYITWLSFCPAICLGLLQGLLGLLGEFVQSEHLGIASAISFQQSDFGRRRSGFECAAKATDS